MLFNSGKATTRCTLATRTALNLVWQCYAYSQYTTNGGFSFHLGDGL